MWIGKNSDVMTKSDMQNLVTSVLLRQSKPFLEKEIYDLVEHFLSGSKFYGNRNLIEEMVNDTIDLFIRNGELRRWCGTLYPSDIDGDPIPEYYEATKKNWQKWLEHDFDDEW